MPGMDGLELQRFLGNADKRIPIVFITAQATDSERRQALAGGAVDLLLKPFSEDALLAAIQAALNR
jgi:two-component system response regulator FixJ